MNDQQEIVDSINHLPDDIRAEVIAAEMLENGTEPSEILIIPDGSFRRKFSKDVSMAEVISLENGQKVIGIHVTRDGLYDALPEAVFHSQAEEPNSSGHDMARLSKHQKTEEKEARRFFLPFENEIFYQRIQLELKERKILHRFGENLFDDIYPQFWKLDKSLPRKLVSRLVLILHLSHKILGNTEITAKCLENILEECVSVRMTNHSSAGTQLTAEIETAPGLGRTRLGENFVCGDFFSKFEPVWEFVIGPLKNSRIEDYLENGTYRKVLDCFYSFFVPVEIDAVTTVKVIGEQYRFTLGDSTKEIILGFNSGI